MKLRDYFKERRTKRIHERVERDSALRRMLKALGISDEKGIQYIKSLNARCSIERIRAFIAQVNSYIFEKNLFGEEVKPSDVSAGLESILYINKYPR